MASGIQRGDRTHHHDQAMCSVNFKPMNKTAKSSKKILPFDLFIICSYGFDVCHACIGIAVNAVSEEHTTARL